MQLKYILVLQDNEDDDNWIYSKITDDKDEMLEVTEVTDATTVDPKSAYPETQDSPIAEDHVVDVFDDSSGSFISQESSTIYEIEV